MVRSERVKSYFFPIGSLTADSDGLFNIYSNHNLNGTIQSVVFQTNNYTTTGSIILFASGLGNSGTDLNEQILKIRAGSTSQTFYPVVYGEQNNNVTGSPQAFIQTVIQSPLRVVGSGLGDSKSGLGIQVYYI